MKKVSLDVLQIYDRENKAYIGNSISDHNISDTAHDDIRKLIQALQQIVNVAPTTGSVSTQIAEAIATHTADDTAHADIREFIQNVSTRLNALADSDDETLDQLSEIVAYIKSNKELIEAITTSKADADHTHTKEELGFKELTADDAMSLLIEAGMINPVSIGDESILLDENDSVLVL